MTLGARAATEVEGIQEKELEGGAEEVGGQETRGLQGAEERDASGESASDRKRREKEEYLHYVELRNIKVAKAVLGGQGVFGEVKNAGDRTLSEVQIIVYCLNSSGQPVYDDTFHPVLVTDSPFAMGDNRPLKPGYSEKFGYSLDDAPSEWSGQVKVQVTNIEFAD